MTSTRPSLASHGETLGEDDERSVTELLIEQVEFADVILISKIDLISAADREELTAILGRLNTHAEILPMSMGGAARPNPRHRPFRFRTRRPGAGLAQEMRGEHVPETEEYGIASTATSARRPFHPQRFYNFLNREWSNGRLLRSKGFFWLATRPEEAGSWSQAGGLMRYDYAGRWWHFTPESAAGERPRKPHGDPWQIRGEFGDCRRELVHRAEHRLRPAAPRAGRLPAERQRVGLGHRRLAAPAGPVRPWHEQVA